MTYEVIAKCRLTGKTDTYQFRTFDSAFKWRELLRKLELKTKLIAL